ncbi:hypothetical protein ACFOON_10300 [Novosphingobium piscinae]|uniref:Uncharacterized protein n=1 Tax=Novosphingobium piscinae TaxID=1507448 RepID=A0A7X1FZV3_9SPHN|nr:hypothetical protein [Novosphingobium piscinae]MBC2670041.1 hypothetical protein [Novosphingobium piscinae]
MAATAAPVLPRWQAAVLRGLVLLGALFVLSGALTLFAIGLLANGRGIGSLHFSWTLFGLSLAAGLAQALLGLLGCRTAWHWIAAHSAPGAADADVQSSSDRGSTTAAS